MSQYKSWVMTSQYLWYTDVDKLKNAIYRLVTLEAEVSWLPFVLFFQLTKLRERKGSSRTLKQT